MSQSQYIKLETVSNTFVFIEVTETISSIGTERIGRGGNIIEGVTKRFDDAIEPLRGISESLISTFKDLASAPEEITVEFSLKVSAEAGIIISSGAVEGNFKVTLKWKT